MSSKATGANPSVLGQFRSSLLLVSDKGCYVWRVGNEIQFAQSGLGTLVVKCLFFVARNALVI